MQTAAWLAFATSALSLLSAIVTYHSERRLSDEYKVTTYFLFLACDRTLDEDIKSVMEDKRGLRNALRLRLETALGAEPKQIESQSLDSVLSYFAQSAAERRMAEGTAVELEMAERRNGVTSNEAALLGHSED